MSSAKTKDALGTSYCTNCDNRIDPSDVFCASCGQKVQSGKTPLIRMTKEFLTEEFNVDSKLIRTIRRLLNPGKLTKDYFEGKRKSQINPMRLFFLIVLLALASMSFYDCSDTDISILGKSLGYGTSKETLEVIDTLRKILEEQSYLKTDTLINELSSRISLNTDSIDLSSDDLTLIRLDFAQNLPNAAFIISRRDYENNSPSQIVKNLGLTGFTAVYYRQKIKLMKNPESLLAFITRNLAWIYLLYIPIIAFVLKILYIRRGRYYVEHLVFSLHQHTLFILFMSVGFLLSQVPFLSNFWMIFLALFAIMLFLSLKRYYEQGMTKTLIKFAILQISYPFILTMFIVSAGLVSLLFF